MWVSMQSSCSVIAAFDGLRFSTWTTAEMLDKARRNVLSEVKQSVQRLSRSKRFEASRLVKDCKPQNVTVLGGTHNSW